MGEAREEEEGVAGGNGSAAGVPDGCHCMTVGAPGLSGRQQHAGSADDGARAEIAASDARTKLLHVKGLKWARESWRCNSLHLRGKNEIRAVLLDTMRREAPLGSEICS